MRGGYPGLPHVQVSIHCIAFHFTYSVSYSCMCDV